MKTYPYTHVQQIVNFAQTFTLGNFILNAGWVKETQNFIFEPIMGVVVYLQIRNFDADIKIKIVLFEITMDTKNLGKKI